MNTESKEDTKQSFYLNLFWAGVILHVLGYAIKLNFSSDSKLSDYVQMLGLFPLFWGGVMLARLKIENNYLKFIFSIYILWAFIVITRGLTFSLNFFRTTLLNNDFGALIYLVPLIILFKYNRIFIQKLFDAILAFGILSIVFEILLFRPLLTRSDETRDIIEFISPYLSMPAGFVLLTFKYHSTTKKLFAFCLIIISLFFSIYQARRGLSTIILSVLVFSYILYLLNTKKKLLAIYLSALIIISGLLYVSNLYQIQNNKLLNRIAERGDEDTRTGVELYFYNDMETTDWIWGRGMDGVYYCPGIDEFEDFRYLIETGYLQIILKGGLTRLILYLLITCPAIILGIFDSRNLLAKASSIWILISLGSLYPTTPESFSLSYILTWVSVGICYSKNLRDLSDENVKLLLFKKENY